jgi:hypothetical protein
MATKLPGVPAPPVITEDVVSDFTSGKMLLIESVTFRDQYKWRVHDGQSAFFTAMDER